MTQDLSYRDTAKRGRRGSGELRIVLVSDLHPHSTHSVRAGNVVVFELARALASEHGVICAFAHVSKNDQRDPTAQEREGAQALAEAGVVVLPPQVVAETSAPRSGVARLLAPDADDFYPHARHSARLWSAIEPFDPDVVFIPWSEWLTAACADFPVAKFAYYGNPDAKSAAARVTFARSQGELPLLQGLLQQWDNRSLERIHLRQMMKYEMLGDVAANDAEYYASRGHPNSFYVRNAWIDRLGAAWRDRRAQCEDPSVIIGNIGRLSGTGNTLGLDILGRELLPLLRERLRGKSYRIRLLGAGELHPAVKEQLRGPEVEIAGFVPDIDQAMLEAGVFLCLNNASHFKVGQTRYLHAWSLGSCVVAHEDCALSMPEIRHDENALLGRNMAEIADLVVRAMGDAALRRRIGEAGYRTFVEKFTAESVASSIVQRIRSHLAGSTRSSAA